jgi:hypothetical protein
MIVHDQLSALPQKPNQTKKNVQISTDNSVSLEPDSEGVDDRTRPGFLSDRKVLWGCLTVAS